MHQVTGEYVDYKIHPRKGQFYLNADQGFNPFTWKPPINWEGTVGGHNVKFTQIEASSFNNESFDWGEFPTELEYVKPYIVEAIDKAMKVMD